MARRTAAQIRAQARARNRMQLAITRAKTHSAGPSLQRIHEADRALTKRMVDLHARWLRHEISSTDYHREHQKLDRRQLALKKFMRIQHFRRGDIIEGPHGHRRVVDGIYMNSDGYGARIGYRTIDSRGVRDMWPAEVVRRRVGHVNGYGNATRGTRFGNGLPSNPSDPQSRYPAPKFKLGQRVCRIDNHKWHGKVSFIGNYDDVIGGYRYKIQEPDGTRLWWNEMSMRRVPRKKRSV
jgi:hypothetical protein